jgi:hypothetical protein
MQVLLENSNLLIKDNNQIFVEHTNEKPFLYVGIGKETIKQHYGDFKIKDKVIEKCLNFLKQ